MNTSQILQKALDILNEKGWNQGDYEGPNGEVCALGAIAASANVSHRNEVLTFDFPATNALISALHAHGATQDRFHASDTCEGNCTWPPHFNDSPNTSEEDIKLLFKHAIQLAEEQENNGAV